MTILKNFVVFEGGDGSGTTTQMGKLRKAFDIGNTEDDSKPFPFLYDTLEPTGGPIGRLVRLGLKGEITLKSETIAMLFAADRNEHLYGPGGIMERCGQGELVVSDRYVLSSLVYQGITCGEEFPGLLNQAFPWPELSFFFDLDPKIAQQRIKDRPEKEIYENLEFQIHVRQRYQTLVKQFQSKGCCIEIIDASRPIEEVEREIWRCLRKMPIFKG